MSVRGVPRGPPEWGEVLYEPRWVYTRRFSNYGSFGLAILLLVATVPLFGLISMFFLYGGLALWNYDSAWHAIRAVLLFVFLIAVTLGIAWFAIFVVLATELEEMPFRVYRAGVTKRYVPWREGLRRREMLIGKERLRSVMVEGRTSDLARRIRLEYTDDEGEVEQQFLAEEDPHEVLRALASLVPEAMHASTAPFLVRGVERLPGVPSLERKRPFTLFWLVLPFILWLLVIMVPFFSMGLRGGSPSTHLWAFELGAAVSISLVLSTGLVSNMYLLSVGHYRWSVYARAQLARDRLVLPPRGPARLMLRARRDIPLGEVVDVRRFLDEHSLSQLAKVRLVSGEEFEVRPGLLRAFARHPSFEMGDYAAVNRGALEVQGGRVVRPKWERALAIVAVPLLVMAYIIYGPEIAALGDWQTLTAVSMVLLQLLVIILMVAVIVIARSLKRWMRRGAGLEATARGLSFPSLLFGRRFVPAGRIEGIEVRSTYMQGYYIRVRKGLLDLTLPLEVHVRLESAGYHIEDPEEVLSGL